MFQITNYSKIVVAIRQQSNILGFHVNVGCPDWEEAMREEQAEFDLQQSGVLSSLNPEAFQTGKAQWYF